MKALTLLVAVSIGLGFASYALGAEAVIDIPEVFAPGVISGPAHDASPAFAPDGKTVYFSRSTASGSTILVSQKIQDVWSTPQIAVFSGQWSDMEPAMSPDGTFMIFVSNRPIQKGGKELDGFFNGHAQPGQGGNLWRVERSGDVWGEPTHISERVNRGNTVFAPSVAANGTLYFMTPDEHSGKFRLHSSQYSNETYQSAEPLLFSDGMSSDVDPAVAPDESFIVFGSGRAPAQDMDLFIAFRENNRWGTPVHMGTKINSPGSDAEARLSPDHSTLYFSSERTTPIRFPRTREQAERDLHRIQLWDNGEYNIWHVSLVPWLEEHLKSQKPSTEHTPQPNSD